MTTWKTMIIAKVIYSRVYRIDKLKATMLQANSKLPQMNPLRESKKLILSRTGDRKAPIKPATA